MILLNCVAKYLKDYSSKLYTSLLILVMVITEIVVRESSSILMVLLH